VRENEGEHAENMESFAVMSLYTISRSVPLNYKLRPDRPEVAAPLVVY